MHTLHGMVTMSTSTPSSNVAEADPTDSGPTSAVAVAPGSPVAPALAGALVPLEVIVETQVDGVLGWEEVEVILRRVDVTVGDVAGALGFDRGKGLVVDGCSVAGGVALRASGIRRGAVLSAGRAVPLCPGAGPSETADPAAERAVPAGETGRAGPEVLARTLSGPDAGRMVSLGPGHYVVGSAAGVDVRLADPVVGRRHCLLEIDGAGQARITDLAPARPSRVDGVAIDGDGILGPGQRLTVGITGLELDHPAGSVGASAAGRVEMGAAADSAGRRSGRRPRGELQPGSWTCSVLRPPAALAPPPIAPVRLPPPVSLPADGVPIGLAAVVITLIAGGLVAWILHQATFLLLGAVGGAGTIGAAVWHRGRRRWHRSSAVRSAHEALAGFGRDLAAHQAAVAERLRTSTLDLVEAVAAARHRGSLVWARPLNTDSTFAAVVGRGDRFQPPTLAPGAGAADGSVAGLPASNVDADTWALIEAASVVPDVPVAVDLGPGAVVGLVGREPAAAALARSLVLQLAVAVGPAHLLIGGVVPDAEATWLHWLPHSVDPTSGERLVGAAADVDEVVGLLEATAEPDGARPHVLLVVEEPTLLAARRSSVRRLLGRDGRSIAALVLAATPDELPAICTTVIEVLADGTAAILRPGSAQLADRVVVAGASAATARAAALGLADLHDPEQAMATADLPAELTLADLVGPALAEDRWLRHRWLAAGADPAPLALLAAAADGPVEIDLVADGPHALVAGTTGSGKSELLRTLIAALAVGAGPDLLSFILIDYKGGSAFDACAQLPHVVGVVTDLDERLGERALRSLHAELRRRERLLRGAGAADLTAYRARAEGPKLSRLVVVVDEFATLAVDLPDFVRSLVGVAQRGRSLGVHLVLATQRPAGAVSDDIRANTNLRIALRVLDGADSTDVIGEPTAAALPRHRPGRGLVRFGAGEVLAVQIAAVTVPLETGDGSAVTVRRRARAGMPPVVARSAPTVLETLVRAAGAAATGLGLDAGPRPWLPPLPLRLSRDELPPGAAGLVDDPDRQAQMPWRWDPADGHLLCIGTIGSGATNALATVAMAASATTPPRDLHVYVVHGGSWLGALAGLAHVGAAIGPPEEERQARLLRRLGSTMAARARAGAGPAERGDVEGRPTILLVVEQLASWRTAVADRLGPNLADLLDRILIDGPGLGIVVAAGLDRPSALPAAVCGAVGERLVFRLADPGDALAVGVRPASITGLAPGRAMSVRSGLSIQVAHTGDIEADIAALALATASTAGVDPDAAPPVPTLPIAVAVDDLPPPSADEHGWSLPVGLADDELWPLELTLHAGDHFLVAGPARSGRSSALALLAAQIRRASPAARLLALAPRSSALHSSAALDGLTASVAELAELLVPAADPPLVVLVDDAELVDDPSGTLSGLISDGTTRLLVAGRVEATRTAYGHWTQALRRQRRGLLLRPQDDLDGDVLGVLLPRRQATPPAPGRGYLIADGCCALVQLACLAMPGQAERPFDG